MAPLRNSTYRDNIRAEFNASLISIVDDDAGVRESISSLVRSAGFRAAVFSSALEFLAAKDTKDAKCLILDVRVPQMSGLELQAFLETTARRIPIIFATRYPDRAVQTKALDHGAVAFLHKPFGDDALLAAMRVALASPAVASLILPAQRAVDM